MAELNEQSQSSITAPTAKSPVNSDAPPVDLRSQRIADYFNDALGNENALVANLGVVNCDLLQMQYLLRRALDDAICQASPSLSDLEIVMPGIDHLVKITKQIDRVTQLEIKVKAGEQAALREEARTAARQLG